MIGTIGYYQSRIDDFLVSPCPYCGLERIIVKEVQPWYEESVSYRVEHKDEAAAVRAKCFTMYESFSSAEIAAEKANERA